MLKNLPGSTTPLKNVFNLIDEAGNNDQEFVKEYLIEAGYNPGKLVEDGKEFLLRLKAELLIKNGREFKDSEEKINNGMNDKVDENKAAEFKLAARNLNGLTENDKKILLDNIKRVERGFNT